MNAMCKMCPLGLITQIMFPERDETNRERTRACRAENEDCSFIKNA